MIFNKYNLKIGDSYKIKNFLGIIIITSIDSIGYHIKLEHVSNEDYYDVISFTDFNNHMLFGNITSIIKS